jgi:hypothetical protein
MVRDEGDQPGEAWGKPERVEEWRRQLGTGGPPADPPLRQTKS